MKNTTISEIMFGILYVAPTLLQILVIFGGVVFAITRIRRYPKPAAWLAAGLSIILVGRIFGWVGTFYLTRALNTEDLVFYSSVLSMLLILISTMGFVLMMCAVFVSRTDRASDEIRWKNKKVQENSGTPKVDPNPYSTPTTR